MMSISIHHSNYLAVEIMKLATISVRKIFYKKEIFIGSFFFILIVPTIKIRKNSFFRSLIMRTKVGAIIVRITRTAHLFGICKTDSISAPNDSPKIMAHRGAYCGSITFIRLNELSRSLIITN